MCGICGIYGEANKHLVQEMLESIKHRGPDAFEVIITGKHSLGVARLELVSSQRGKQPAIFKDGLAILFNGEIYNYLDIAHSLSMKDLPDVSEVEVIRALYNEQGVEALSKLKGMFALAILDNNTLILARDRFGIKPLFYYRTRNTFLFASEIKALLRHPEVTPELNTQTMEETAVLGFIYSSGMTLFKDIHQVQPGSILKITPDSIAETPYYKLPSALYGRSEQLLSSDTDMLNSIIKESVKKVMQHGKDKKGIYLSGGVDSSILAVLASEVSNEPVSTFTLYDSNDSLDIKSARRVAKAIGSNHFELKIEYTDYLNELPGYIYHYESLMTGGVFDIQGGVAFHLLSKEVAKHVRVALSGEGADELFGGYYWEYLYPLGFSDRIKERINRIKIRSQTTELIDNLFPIPENEQLYRANIFDLLMKSGLTNHHLWCVDRSSSAFGFEIRPAYLDYDLSDHALSLPIQFKVSKTKKETKIILKNAAKSLFSKYGLTDVVFRPKKGMPDALNRISSQMVEYANRIFELQKISNHGLGNYFVNPLEIFYFDLFHWIFIEKKGRLPSDINISELYKERDIKKIASQY